MDGVAIPGKLKLKKDSGVKKKKKKSANATELKEKINAFAKEKGFRSGRLAEEEMFEKDPDAVQEDDVKEFDDTFRAPSKTKAELAFARRQAELQGERIRDKAQTSHRGRVEAFNKKMDDVTEFNDIPKVSWTK